MRWTASWKSLFSSLYIKSPGNWLVLDKWFFMLSFESNNMGPALKTTPKIPWEIAHPRLVEIQDAIVIFDIYRQIKQIWLVWIIIRFDLPGTSRRDFTHVCQNRIRIVMMMPWRWLNSLPYLLSFHLTGFRLKGLSLKKTWMHLLYHLRRDPKCRLDTCNDEKTSGETVLQGFSEMNRRTRQTVLRGCSVRGCDQGVGRRSFSGGELLTLLLLF